MTRLALLTLTASAVLASAPAAAAPKQKPQLPFGFTLGVTTLEDARTAWKDQGVRVIRQAAATTGPSSLPTSDWGPADRIQLVQVANVSFEGVPPRPAQFGFFDGVLFHVTQPFRPALKVDEKEYPPRKEDPLDPKVLEQTLRRRFGAPTKFEDTIMDGKVLTWRSGATTLVFMRGGITDGLTMLDEKIAKAANAYRRPLADQEDRKRR